MASATQSGPRSATVQPGAGVTVMPGTMATASSEASATGGRLMLAIRTIPVAATPAIASDPSRRPNRAPVVDQVVMGLLLTHLVGP
ncbi:hypothetical protein ATCCBAA256_33700 [Mycobacterium montefiorense]|nr:hypothetical protein ATCCBAA256_33700 [Mycobacterium montefiorense]